MGIEALIESTQVVIDSDGIKRAVLIDYTLWEQIVEMLEDWEDSNEMDAMRDEKTVPWNTTKAELRNKGINV